MERSVLGIASMVSLRLCIMSVDHLPAGQPLAAERDFTPKDGTLQWHTVYMDKASLCPKLLSNGSTVGRSAGGQRRGKARFSRY